ncbi:MAG TPA: hypothetical protein PLS82_01110, partial [Phycisphaerae bacterium]|nr:hypothetical protein [Phycisphaerae bacterium]
TIPAVLEAGLRAAGSRADEPGQWRAKPTRWQGSGDPLGLARSNGLIVREAGVAAAREGSIVQVIPLG